MHVPVNLDLIDWDSILNRQQTGNGPFVGVPRQRGGMRGRGIGGVLSALLTMIPKFFGSTVGQEVLNAGKNIVSDVTSGNNVLSSVKTNTRSAVRNLTGLGLKRAIGVIRPHKGPSVKRKRSVRLIV